MVMSSPLMHHEMRDGQVSLLVLDGDSLEMLSEPMTSSVVPMLNPSYSSQIALKGSGWIQQAISSDSEMGLYEHLRIV